MFSLTQTPFVFAQYDPNFNINQYAYGALSWNEDGRGDGRCQNPTAVTNNEGSGAITTGNATAEDLSVLNGTDTVTVWTDDYSLQSFSHINTYDGTGAAWNIAGKAGDKRMYSGGVGEIRVGGQTVLRVIDMQVTIISRYPDQTGAIGAQIGAIGDGGPVGSGVGIGVGTIDVNQSNDEWEREFDATGAGNTGAHSVEFSFGTMSPTLQGCFGTYELSRVVVRPVANNAVCDDDDLSRDTDEDGILDVLDQHVP